MSTSTYRVGERKCATCRWWQIAVIVAVAFLGVRIGLAVEMPLSVSLASLGRTETATQKTATPDTIKVQGRGVGADQSDALKDAYRDAIEHAVGLYVDAEQAAENGELIRDQILTQSNAYIEKYRIVSTLRRDNLFEVRIVAEVRKRELTVKMSSVMPEKVFSLDDGLLKRKQEEIATLKMQKKREEENQAAKEFSQKKRNDDAAALIKNLFAGFNPSAHMLDITTTDKKPIVQASSGEVTISIDLSLNLATKKYYDELLPRFKRVLEQVALRDPVAVSFILKRYDSERNFELDPLFFNSPTRNIAVLSLSGGVTWNGCDIEIGGTSYALNPCSISKHELPNCNESEPTVWLVDRVSGSGNPVRVYMIGYLLSDTCAMALYQAVRKWASLPPVEFEAELLNSAGDAITKQKFEVNQDCGWIGWGSGLKNIGLDAFYIRPWMSSVAHSSTSIRFVNGEYWDSNGNYLGKTLDEAQGQFRKSSHAAFPLAESIPFRCSFKVLESELSSVASVRIRPVK